MSVIYKIYCKDENIKDCYIGSTNDLHKRKIIHKSDCNNLSCKSYNLKVYQFIRANGGFENFDFQILEQFENIMTKKDLFKIEGQYINNNNCTLNSYVAGRTSKDYKEENIIKIQEYKQEYYQDNKKEIKEKSKQYRIKNKQEVKDTLCNWYKANKTKHNQTSHLYYLQNKEKLKEKVECIYCKALITKYSLRAHQNRKKCLSFQNTNQI